MAWRRTRKPTGDPATEMIDVESLPAAYRSVVVDATRARAQFQSLAASVQPGPLQDRLQEIGSGVDAGVLAVWRSVQHAMRLEAVVATLDPERVTEDLKRARRAALTDRSDAHAVEALNARFASTQRLLNALDEMRQRLPTLEARLGTAVARAAELTLTSSLSPSTSELGSLRDELDQVVIELDALQAAAEMTD